MFDRITWKRQYNQKPIVKMKAKAYRSTNRHSLKLYFKERNHLSKTKALMVYSNPTGSPICNHCGEQDIDVLCIDHVDDSGAEHRRAIANHNLYFWLKACNYPQGYQVLCWNCNHRKARIML